MRHINRKQKKLINTIPSAYQNNKKRHFDIIVLPLTEFEKKSTIYGSHKGFLQSKKRRYYLVFAATRTGTSLDIIQKFDDASDLAIDSKFQ